MHTYVDITTTTTTNNNNNNNTVELCCFLYEWVNFSIPSVLSDTRRETQIRAYDNYNAANLVSLIASHLCRSRPKLSDLLRPEKNSSAHFDGSTSTPSFQILKFSGDLFRTWGNPLTRFLSGTLLYQMMIVISFLLRQVSFPSDNDTGNKRHRVIQRLTKLNNKI